MSEQDNQVVEATNSTEEVVVEQETTTEDGTVEIPEVKTYSEDEFKQVLARAKIAEAKLKQKPVESITKQDSLSAEEVDVKILQSQGYSDELITDLKAVAKARGKSLLASTQDSIFLAIKNEKEAEAKAQKAKLGASRGSGQQKKEKSIATPNLSDEEHKELWKQARDK